MCFVYLQVLICKDTLKKPKMIIQCSFISYENVPWGEIITVAYYHGKQAIKTAVPFSPQKKG